MYNQKIIDRINNLTYLKALKNSNASAITKKNPYGDIVKFYAQINKNDVIQAISFKCTGCSYFTALCSYFCELAEGKTVTDALKIKEKDLVAFAKLDESRHHIYPLILGTFALLVKRYRKGVESGKIVPCEIVEIRKEDKKVSTKRKAVDISKGLDDMLVSSATKSSKSSKTTITTLTTEITGKSVRKATAKSDIIEGKIDKSSMAKGIAKTLGLDTNDGDKTVKAKTQTKVSDKKESIAKSKPLKEKTVKEPKENVSTKKVAQKKKETVDEKTIFNKTKKITKVTEEETNKSIKDSVKKETSKGVLVGEKEGNVESNNISKRIKSVDLAIINEKHAEDKKQDVVLLSDSENKNDKSEEIIVTDNIPNATQNTTQVIVQTVEQKRSIKTTVKNGETTTIAGEKINAMSLHAEGEEVHKQIHSSSSLSDMINRLNSSKSKINSVEAHSMTRVAKSVNGKTLDSASTLTSFSSMRDSLHKIRENNVHVVNESSQKSLPMTQKKLGKGGDKTVSQSKIKDEDVFVERAWESKDIAKEVKEKEEKGTKKGLFGWLFKK